MRKNCATCEHRAELNPEYQDMEWDKIPCSGCEIPALHDDEPDFRAELVGNQGVMEKIVEAKQLSFVDRPLTDARKADLMMRIMRNMKDDSDRKLAQFILDNPSATQDDMSDHLGLKRRTIRDRLRRLKK